MQNILKNRKIQLALAGGFGAIAIGGLGFAYATARPVGANDPVAKKIAAALPNTKVSQVSCGKPVKGLCEVVAGKNVFYTTPDAHYIVVGSILDLQTKKDLTDDRLKELAAVDSALAKISGDAGTPSEVPVQPVANPQPAQSGDLPSAGVIKIDLPKGNAIVHNPGAPIKISVFSDYNCHFCRALYDALASANDIEVTEYPIAILGQDSETKAKLVLCSTDRVGAAKAAYAGGQLTVPGNCAKTDGIVDQNSAFARAHSITGTPTIIRADGESQMGFKTLDDLRAWAKGA